jgi:hypothetical protein
METFTRLFGSLLLFVYHCFDRIVINGYLGGSQRAGRFAFRLFLTALACARSSRWRAYLSLATSSLPSTSGRVVLVVLPLWPLRATPPTSCKQPLANRILGKRNAACRDALLPLRGAPILCRVNSPPASTLLPQGDNFEPSPSQTKSTVPASKSTFSTRMQ